MKRLSAIAYDICRSYLTDSQDALGPQLTTLLLGKVRARDLAALASCTSHFDSAKHTVEALRSLKQVEAFFKKNSQFSNPVICANAAQQSFKDSEASCAKINWMLEYFYAQQHLLRSDLRSKIQVMESYISRVLGPFSVFMNDLPSLVKVTPGATATTARKDSLPQLKMKMKVFATDGARSYTTALYQFFGFNRPRVCVTESNRVELVPKNWKTDRTIACEPEANLPLQLAFDRFVKRRLYSHGVDLSDQSANQRRALEASVTDSFVTVDFKAASDTFSFNTVAWLMPPDWFDFLCRVRSPKYRGAFGSGTYQKFSSMGNGCTFCIETLIFAAACYASGSRNFLVYGDDVIIEKEFYPSFLELTGFFGLTVNVDKTFVSGFFRESCGVDAYNGMNITPVFIREQPTSKAGLCHLINTMCTIAYPEGKLVKLLLFLKEEYKLPCVPYVMDTYAGVHIEPGYAYDQRILRLRHWCYRFKAYKPKTEKRQFSSSKGYYLWFLNKTGQVSFSGPWHLKKNISQTQTSSAPLPQHCYVRKWASWVKPRQAIPEHLYWCSELFLPPRLKKR